MTVLELCQLAELDSEAQQAAQSGLPLRTFVEQLTRTGQVRAAVSALAQVLPKAEAIAWALGSIRGIEAAAQKPGAAETMEAIGKWLEKPDDEKRRAVRNSAERAGIATPAGCLGMAVFFSGGSMAPADSPTSPEPARHVCGKMVTGALNLALALEPARAGGQLRAFFDAGMRRANEIKIWEKEV